MSAPQQAFAERPSGLLVPAQTLDKQTHVLPESDFKKLRRLMLSAREHKMVAKFWCQTCHGPIELTQEDRIVLGKDGNEPGGRFVLSCGCSTWTVR